MAIPNILAAMEMGVTNFDASIGGLGGCPFAPGASGNVLHRGSRPLPVGHGRRDGHRPRRAHRRSKRVQEIVGRSLPGQIVKAGKWSRRYPLPDGVQSRLAAR
jgi:hydroxymethylglutaryl-CoA lyase